VRLFNLDNVACRIVYRQEVQGPLRARSSPACWRRAGPGSLCRPRVQPSPDRVGRAAHALLFLSLPVREVPWPGYDGSQPDWPRTAGQNLCSSRMPTARVLSSKEEMSFGLEGKKSRRPPEGDRPEN